MTIHELFDKIVTNFNFYESYLNIGNIHNGIVKTSKLRELAINLEGLGYDTLRFSNYLTKLLSVGYKMEYKVPDNGAYDVKIMTIHKSKVLEYPVCYFSGLYKEFNISDLKERFLVDKEFGIIVPYFNEGIGNTIYKELLRQNYLKEEISEKIRLFYVALTRAREKMILVKPINEKEYDNSNVTVLDNSIKSKYRTLADMLDTIEFRISSKYKTIDLETLNLTKDYAIVGRSNFKDNLTKVDEIIEVKELEIKNVLKEQSTFSKKTNTLITKDTYNSIKFGTKIHEYLEFIDFKNPNLEVIPDNFIKKLIQNLINQPIMKNLGNATIYQEYEFIYEENSTEYHGVIDLMIEYDNYINIIDYKLKNITDDAYEKQLKGYKKYIETKTKKQVNLYLYSILDSKLVSIE